MGKLHSIEDLFRGRHSNREVMITFVGCYLRYKLSYRDLVETMAECGLDPAHTTVLRWLQRIYFGVCQILGSVWKSFWSVLRFEETYIKARGNWAHV
jgi:transposase-like protein